MCGKIYFVIVNYIFFIDGVCLYHQVMKNALSLQLVLFMDALLFTRYVFIFWHKNPAIFQDAFWSLFINIWVVSFSFISQLIFTFTPGKFVYFVIILQDKSPI